MKLRDKRIVLTGAGGGIGRALAQVLATRGARLVLVGRQQATLAETVATLDAPHSSSVLIEADLATAAGCRSVADGTLAKGGHVDVLINNAGVMQFNRFCGANADEMLSLIGVNIAAPQLLARLLLPGMLARGQGCIVNIGSGFGSIGYPYHVGYSASKFALRGFSEALRRELHGTGVGVTYVAPRATRTAMHNHNVAEAVGMNVDAPEMVAQVIARAIERDRNNVFIGIPERVFATLNALFPALIDSGLRGAAKALQPLAEAKTTTLHSPVGGVLHHG